MSTVQAAISNSGPARTGPTPAPTRCSRMPRPAAPTGPTCSAPQSGIRVAAIAWEGCGEFAKARLCRCDLAAGGARAARPVRRGARPDGDDPGGGGSLRRRAVLDVAVEGFVLVSANRLDSAESPIRASRRPRLHPGQPADHRRRRRGDGRMFAARRDDVGSDGALVRHCREHGARRPTTTFLVCRSTAMLRRCSGPLARSSSPNGTSRSPNNAATLTPTSLRSPEFILEARRGVRRRRRVAARADSAGGVVASAARLGAGRARQRGRPRTHDGCSSSPSAS